MRPRWHFHLSGSAQPMKGKNQMAQVWCFRMFRLVAVMSMVSVTLVAQDDLAAIQQKLNAQFKLTTTTADLSAIVTPGDMVEMQKGGLNMSARSSLLKESNTYKDGKIEGGATKRTFGKFSESMLRGIGTAVDPTVAAPSSIPPRTLAAGDRCWVAATTVQDDGILFKLYGDPSVYGIGYHADLKIAFPKKKVPTADAAMQLVAEVLKVVPSGDQGGHQTALAGQYLMEQTGLSLHLLPDGSCTTRVPGGTPAPCHFVVDGDWLVVKYKIGNIDLPLFPGNIKIQGDNLYLSGVELVRQGGTPAQDPAVAAALPTPPATASMPDIAPPPPSAPAPVQTKSPEDIRARNAEALNNNEIINGLNADLRICMQDMKDGDGAPDAETKAAKYGEIETLMLRDTQAKPDASVLWVELGRAQAGLKKYTEAESSFTRALELENVAEHPNSQIKSLANAELSKIHASTGIAAGANTTPPAPASMPAIVPPPPPADAPPPTISIGQTMDQVTAGFGQPLKIAKLGVKTIFYFKDMKVTFTNGKVSSVE